MPQGAPAKTHRQIERGAWVSFAIMFSFICKLKGRTDRVREPQVCEKSTLTDAHEFPVGATKIPVLRNLFPVNLIRELAPKCRGNGVSGSRGRFPPGRAAPGNAARSAARICRRSAPWGIERRPFRPPPRISGECDVLIPQRHRTDSLSGCREVGIEHGRRRDADRRLADAAPEAAARHDDRLNLRHLADPHRIVSIGVRLLHTAVPDGPPAIRQPRQAVDKRAGDLAFDFLCERWALRVMHWVPPPAVSPYFSPQQVS